MTLEDLKQKKRDELANLVLAQEKEINNLTAELMSARRKLRDRNIQIEECGSIAEAAMSLSEVIQSAQTAADIYLENVRRMQDETKEKCASLENEAMEKAEKILEEVQKQADIMLNNAAVRADDIINKAEKISEEKISEASTILETAKIESENIRDVAVQYFVEMSSKNKNEA